MELTMTITVAPGSVVQVCDEEWLVSTVEQTDDGQLVTVQSLSDLVRGTTATFYEHLDTISAGSTRSDPGSRNTRLRIRASGGVRTAS